MPRSDLRGLQIQIDMLTRRTDDHAVELAVLRTWIRLGGIVAGACLTGIVMILVILVSHVI